jgi:peptidoglycan/LPS O-acetylase OafA/YrhL
LSLRPIVILGEASYAIYMLHVPLYLLMDKRIEHRLTANARCAVYLAALVAISIVIHYAWERPLRRLIVQRRSLTGRVHHMSARRPLKFFSR